MRQTAPKRVLIVDASLLAKNMYRLLFLNVGPYEIDYRETLGSFEKKKPHLIILNSNAVPAGQTIPVPDIPLIILASKSRTDLQDQFQEKEGVIFVEKPFYPYDLLSEVNRLLVKKVKFKKRGRPRKR